MLRTYGNRPSQVPQKPKQPEFVPKERSKEELRQWQSTFNVISFLLKSHARQSTAASWAKIKRFWQIKKKYSTFLLNKLHLLQKRKARQYLKSSLSALQSNRINFYTNKKAENIKLKQNLKNKSTALIVIIATKLQKAKVRSYFQELRIRSQLKAKLGTFKNTHLFSRLSSLYLTKLRDTFNKINIFGKYKLKKVRNLSRIEKLISTKTKAYLLYSIMKLKINVFVTKNKQALQKQQKAAQPQTKTTPRKPVPQQKPQVQPNNDKQLEQEIRKLQNEEKTLNQKKKNLERDLNKLETDSQKTLNDFRKEIERLQRQNSQLVFNNDLLEQNNQELQREYQNKQRTSRKKLSRAQIWQNVYNNLMHFLTINKDKQITKAALLQCLELPLVPCNINVDQLKDQNQILSELLEQYKKNFPPPQVTEAQIEPLPFEIIRKQNRYYYMVLQVLSEWGTNGSKQLQQLNKDLTSLQKKLGS